MALAFSLNLRFVPVRTSGSAQRVFIWRSRRAFRVVAAAAAMHPIHYKRGRALARA